MRKGAIRSFVDVIDAWPSRIAFARDIGASIQTVNRFRQSNFIPEHYFRAIAEGQTKYGLTCVTTEALTRLSEEADLKRRSGNRLEAGSQW